MMVTTAAAILVIHLVRWDKSRQGKLTKLSKSPTLPELFLNLRCRMNLR